MGKPVNLYAAKTHLSQLVDRAIEGEEVIIARHGRPVAKLIPYRRTPAVRRLGQFRGQVRIAPDFDELPADLAAAFAGDGVRLLLDTHVMLWALSAPRTLAAPTRALIADPANDVWVSVASLWEVAIKQQLGKLTLPKPARAWLPPALVATGMSTLDIRPQHAYAAATLPHHHGDPFDRMIIAQAQDESLTVVTRDDRFQRYEVMLLPA